MEREIRIMEGDNLESVVYTLLAAKARGEHVYCNFKGHKLHSNTVSMDSAYMEVVGCTKAEYDQQMKEYEKMRESVEQNAKNSILSWIERGQALIFPERYEEWKKCVKARATNLYRGKDLGDALEIMEALDRGASIEEAKKIFDGQGNTGMSASMIRNIIFVFSSQGPEFFEATAYGELSPEDKQAIEAKKQENKQLAFAQAKKEYYEQEMKEYEKMKEIAEQKAKESIPSWIERGQALIFPERYEEWEKCVRTRAKALSYSNDLDDALEIMEALDRGASMEEAIKILAGQRHLSATMVRNIIFAFSNQGPEFWEATAYGEISPEDKQAIEAKKQENKQLAEEHAKTDGSGRRM